MLLRNSLAQRVALGIERVNLLAAAPLRLLPVFYIKPILVILEFLAWSQTIIKLTILASLLPADFKRFEGCADRDTRQLLRDLPGQAGPARLASHQKDPAGLGLFERRHQLVLRVVPRAPLARAPSG